VRAASVVAGCLLLVATACSGSGAPGTPVGSPVAGPAKTYAAIGASETVGVGTADPLRDAWPRVLWRDALPGYVYIDFGAPGATVAQALTQQVGPALHAHPDVVTVWLNVNDLLAGVTPARYERELLRSLMRLRAGGVPHVLVATTPVLTSLPAYLACRPSPPAGGPPCAVDRRLPPPAVVRARVAAYNAAIRRDVAQTGALLVDLHALGDVAKTNPADVADDGFHPSTAGARRIAATFASALESATGS
jgi:acyl-CoA thioesterase-1